MVKKNNKNFKYGKIISMHQMLKYHSCCGTFFTNEIFFYLPINNNYLLPPPPTKLKFHPTKKKIPSNYKDYTIGTKRFETSTCTLEKFHPSSLWYYPSPHKQCWIPFSKTFSWYPMKYPACDLIFQHTQYYSLSLVGYFRAQNSKALNN